jgi:hypothetical protein
MPVLSRLVLVALSVAVLPGCDSTSPAPDRSLGVLGEVSEQGRIPVPPLPVTVQAWPAATAGGADTATTFTGIQGGYIVELGPFAEGRLDSLRVRVTQSDCGMQVNTDVRHGAVTIGEDDLVMPALDLSYRLPEAQFEVGGAMCGAIVIPTIEGTTGDFARLALWIDDISDSVRGRWRLNHTASSADDFGGFSGSVSDNLVILALRATQPTPCTGLSLAILVGGDNGSTLAAGDLEGDGSCFVPSTTLVRFFEGAELSEPLP